MSDWQSTTCMRCAVGCGHRQRPTADGDSLGEVTGDPSHPATGGAKCQRGVSETLAPDGKRITDPLIRRGGTLQPTDWETALGLVTSRFIEALGNNNGNIAVLGSGQQTNEAAYALGKLARGGFGTPYYDSNTTLCMASAVSAYFQSFGSDAPPPTYDDIPKADTHLIWGANPATAHPVVYRWITDSVADDGQLIVVDPVETATADDADTHVRPDPGTDLALARAVLAAVIDAGDVDTEFIESQTTGYEELVDSLPTLDTAAETAGVDTDTIETIADGLTDDTLLYWGMGVNQSIQGTATARALIDLCLVTGNMGPGSGPFSLTGQANSMGNRVCSSKGTWPGHRAFDDETARKAVAEAWDVPLSRLPETTGPGFVGIVDAIARGESEVCWTVATNPAAGMPDAGQVTDVLEEVFLVAQDAFYSETVACADVVLPAATWGETEGTATNMERRVSRVRQAVDPPGAARQDLDIIAAIGNRVETGLFAETPLDPGRVFDELTALTAGTTADLSGISYDRLTEELAVRWPAPAADSHGGYRYHGGGDRWQFETESGRARFSAATHSGVPEPLDAAYPLVLTTGRCAGVYNTGIRNRADDDTVPDARIHPETVGNCLDAFDRSRTVIESRRDSVTVTVAADDSVPPGMVWVPIHNPAANKLTLPAVDPESDEPNLKQCAVTVRAPPRSTDDDGSKTAAASTPVLNGNGGLVDR